MSSPGLGGALDRGTRAWWRLVGRPVDLDGSEEWLNAPTAGSGPEGSLVLSSPAGTFGSDGAYVVARASAGAAYARRVPLHERFQVYRDHRGVLRTDHQLRLYQALVMRLHYRLEKA